MAYILGLRAGGKGCARVCSVPGCQQRTPWGKTWEQAARLGVAFGWLEGDLKTPRTCVMVCPEHVHELAHGAVVASLRLGTFCVVKAVMNG